MSDPFTKKPFKTYAKRRRSSIPPTALPPTHDSSSDDSDSDSDSPSLPPPPRTTSKLSPKPNGVTSSTTGSTSKRERKATEEEPPREGEQRVRTKSSVGVKAAVVAGLGARKRASTSTGAAKEDKTEWDEQVVMKSVDKEVMLNKRRLSDEKSPPKVRAQMSGSGGEGESGKKKRKVVTATGGTQSPNPTSTSTPTPTPSSSPSKKRVASVPPPIATTSSSPTKSTSPAHHKKLSPSRSPLLAPTSLPLLPPAPTLTVAEPSPPTTTSFPPSLSPPKSPSSRRTLSPAKDLSGVFESFGAGTSTASASGVGTSSARVVGKLGGRTPTAPISPSRSPASTSTLVRSSSHPQPLPSPSRPPTPLKPNHSLPLLSPSPSRTLSRTNSSMVVEREMPRPPPTSSAILGGGGGAKKTYGGARKFKVDVEGERNLLEGVPSTSTSTSTSSSSPAIKLRRPPLQASHHKETTSTSYSALRTLWGVDVEEELLEEWDQSLEGGSTKSLNILRAKGENKRWGDEFEYLVEGLGGEGKGVKRSSAIEVLKKLTEDKEFVRRLKASGFVDRVYKEFRKAQSSSNDKILDLALVFLTAFLLRDSNVAETLLGIESATNEGMPDLLEALSTLVERKGEEDPKGKDDVRAMKNLMDVIHKSGMVVGDGGAIPVSIKSLSIITLSLIASFPPRSTFVPQQMLLESGAIDSAVKVLGHESDVLVKRVDQFQAGLDFIPADKTISLPLIDTLLQTIESCSTVLPANTINVLNSHVVTLSTALASLVLCSNSILSSPYTISIEQGKASLEILIGGLRMLIELTTAEASWNLELAKDKEFVRTLVKVIGNSRRGREEKIKELGSADEEVEMEVVDEEKKKGAAGVRFDILCLALGVLTNLVESANNVKDLLREIRLAPNCEEHRKCARECYCPSRVSAIVRITDLYLDPLEDSSNELDTSFINGYSGILVGLVMLDSPMNQDIVVRALEHHKEPMDKLLEAMEEFATLHENAAEAENEEDGEGGQVAAKLRELVKGVKERIAMRDG